MIDVWGDVIIDHAMVVGLWFEDFRNCRFPWIFTTQHLLEFTQNAVITNKQTNKPSEQQIPKVEGYEAPHVA